MWVLKGKGDSAFPRVARFPGDRARLAALAGHRVTSESRGLHGWCSLCLRQSSRGTSASYPLLLSRSTAFPRIQHPCLLHRLSIARAAPAAHSLARLRSLPCSPGLGAVHSRSNKHTGERNKARQGTGKGKKSKLGNKINVNRTSHRVAAPAISFFPGLQKLHIEQWH